MSSITVSEENELSGLVKSPAERLLENVYTELRNCSTIVTITLSANEDHYRGPEENPEVTRQTRSGDVSLVCETQFGPVGDCVETTYPSSRCVSLKELCYVALATMAGQPTAEGCMPNIAIEFSTADVDTEQETIVSFGRVLVAVNETEPVHRLEPEERQPAEPCKRRRSQWKRAKQFLRRLLCCGRY
ncbi:unnamed protein product [Macrosiphum euphorbiae]|uniref:Uncharacterized protein n=1 Tax=Macrosiphum euphorbiae TaxID=13131 RepID=A0AAV0X7R9_9HEMI|nr:unnamed protein product [Macrosiphum euphorbiae]